MSNNLTVSTSTEVTRARGGGTPEAKLPLKQQAFPMLNAGIVEGEYLFLSLVCKPGVKSVMAWLVTSLLCVCERDGMERAMRICPVLHPRALGYPCPSFAPAAGVQSVLLLLQMGL